MKRKIIKARDVEGKKLKMNIQAIEFTCCRHVYMLRTHGKKHGEWHCSYCNKVILWQWQAVAKVLATKVSPNAADLHFSTDGEPIGDNSIIVEAKEKMKDAR